MSARDRARSVSRAEGVDRVRALQRVLYRCAKQDRDRRFHALYDKVARSDVIHGSMRRREAARCRWPFGPKGRCASRRPYEAARVAWTLAVQRIQESRPGSDPGVCSARPRRAAAASSSRQLKGSGLAETFG
jgi:hypothetical protein